PPPARSPRAGSRSRCCISGTWEVPSTSPPAQTLPARQSRIQPVECRQTVLVKQALARLRPPDRQLPPPPPGGLEPPPQAPAPPPRRTPWVRRSASARYAR